MKRLNQDVLASLAGGIAVPGYDRAKVDVGILHLGVGVFHRAHQAVYTDDILAGGATEWGICAVDLLASEVRDALAPQDLLYTVATQSGEGQSLRVVGSLRELLVGPENPAKLLARMTDPKVRIVSITVTEKGYCYDPTSGGLNTMHPGIAADLKTPNAPSTIVGYIAEALHRRREAGTLPFTVMSCDNLALNGRIAKTVVTDFARARDPEFGDWVAANVRFPCTMVDRITPATTPDAIKRVQADLGAEDAWPVVCEPFRQWVIEDDFPLGRPRWEDVGAELVDDVEPFEFMKLRLLNGSHLAMGYLGVLAGYDLISTCMADPAFLTFMRRLMDEDVTPTLHMPASVDIGAYKDSLVERFANPTIKYRTAQVAQDGSQKLPQRLCGPVRERLATGGTVTHLALVVAAWIRYAGGFNDAGRPIDVNDPMAPRFLEITKTAGGDVKALVAGFLSLVEIFGDDLRGATPFVDAVTTWLESLIADGAKATVARHYGA